MPPTPKTATPARHASSNAAHGSTGKKSSAMHRSAVGSSSGAAGAVSGSGRKQLSKSEMLALATSREHKGASCVFVGLIQPM